MTNKEPILSREEVLDALTVPGLNVEAALEPREVGLLCVAIIDLLEKLCGEPVAWKTAKWPDGLTPHKHVGQRWLEEDGDVIPLYALNRSKS